MRFSVYLTDKAQALQQSIQFFSGSVDAKEKKIVFLAQIDFWDWEMENLIYSFDSFQRRAVAWRSTNYMEEQLLKSGILVPSRLLNDLHYKRYWDFRDHRQQVQAPIELLNEVIQDWNNLIDWCDKSIVGNVEHANQWGANFKSMTEFKKQPLDIIGE